MNLEDRLRSHMQSGDELFVETGRDAGAIAAAGRRRTRRNQIGGAAAGGMLALGLVFGVASQIGGDDQADFASEGMSNTESAAIEMESDVAASDIRDEGMGLPIDPNADTVVAPGGFIEYEFIVGVSDGFAGIRATEAGIVALRSDDGDEWSVTPTAGIPDGAEITGIVHDDGVFAAPFTVYDELAGSFTSFIGTSQDLVDWTVEVIDFGDDFEDPFLNEVMISNGEVVAVVPVGPSFDEAATEVAAPSIFVLRGPAGGPYESTLLPDSSYGVSGLAAADDAVMFVVSGDDGSRVWSSTAGGPWTVAREASFEEFPTLANVGASVLLFDGSGVERSIDGGSSWEPVDVAGVSDFTVASTASEGDTLAVLFLSLADDGQSFTLAAGSAGALVVVPTDDVVPERAFVLLAAVSDEEALLEVFPEPEVFDEELAASGGLVEVVPDGGSLPPRYVRVPLG